MDDEIKVIVAEYAKEQDPEKKAALKARLDAEVASRKMAEAAGPRYPVGLQVRFGKRQATVTQATPGGPAGWTYAIDLKAGEVFGLGDGVYQKTEAEMRQILADEVHAPLATDQDYPAGIAVYRNGQGGLIEKAEQVGGVWTYTIQGWPRPVTQAELAAVLKR